MMAFDEPRPVFFVEDELDPALGEPMNGLTYLKVVRHEANRLADVNVSDIDPRAYDSAQNKYVDLQQNRCIPAPPGCEPSNEWINSFVEGFVFLRNKFFDFKKTCITSDDTRLPKDENGWRRFCLGSADSSDSPKLPTPSLLCRLDEVSVVRLLKYHIRWATDRESELTEESVVWLFSLLVALDTPLNASTQAELRSLMCRCCELRSKTPPSDSAFLLPKLNILITIISVVFGQTEVLD
ncbi:gem-associated protein 2-like [Schistocerca gregaria]|uniref:gem-associated protein 2-like n=1 Tax=Schistocerca gregaria TaxID=7010 RepID=UPI00211E1A8B|nr:gem-associated protein 2-like [Schistocerca gregaria]